MEQIRLAANCLGHVLSLPYISYTKFHFLHIYSKRKELTSTYLSYIMSRVAVILLILKIKKKIKTIFQAKLLILQKCTKLVTLIKCLQQ